jgi:DNA-directed DNA polymerase III PolC
VFTPLRVRSHGSLLAGVASPERLVDAALERGHSALALTDRDNLYLAIRFLKAAAAAGLRALPGAELTQGRASALLLAADRRGWASLCALLTARRLDERFDLVRALGERHAGLQVIVESPSLAAALLAAGVPPAQRADDERAKPLARRGGLWLGVRGLPFERPRLRAKLAEGWRLGVPAVATGDVMLLDPADHEAHRVAVTAAAGELLERMPPSAFCAREAWLASPAEWERRVRAVCGGAGCAEAAGELLANNAALARRCGCEVETGTPIFPRAPLPDGVTAEGRLRALALAGVPRRYPAPSARRAALARLEEELALVAHMGFTDYFLLVADIVGFAHARGIPTVGRGSGASSMVSYLLGVTSVDPIRYGLCFERFLHPQRRDCPDLDVDLCWRRRDEVIAHVYEAYGHDRVAMISTHATLGPRSAFREAAKALGVPLPRVNALARRVPRGELPDASALEKTLHAGHADEFREPRIAEALRLAATLAGAPRHLSIHCGGLVIADRELTHYLPLERAAKGVVVSQFEMRAVEAIGLVKMDLLGNRAITTIGECLTLAARCAREAPVPEPSVLDAEQVPEDDPATREAVAGGDTLNCFQLESPAMRHLLRMLRARTLDDTVAAVALVRPGPAESGMKEAFCRRARGLEPVAVPHPRLRGTLAETHGVMLYEEDVMRVASALCGMPLAEGETLRRAIAGARTDEEFRFLERGFLAQAAHAGIAGPDARTVWRELARFAGYAFCKAHAAGYGRLGWQAAYFKTRFPAAWAVGILNHHAGMYPTWVHVEDLRRHGVTFRPPCVNTSAWDSTLEGAEPGRGGVVRVGLHRVQGLAHATGERLLAERTVRPFAGLADLADRVRPTPPELEALVLAGALDGAGRSRAALLLEARVGAAMAAHAGPRRVAAPALASAGGAPLAPAAAAPRPGGEALPELPEFALADRVRGEFAATGLWFSAHPLGTFGADAARRGCVDAGSLERHAGRRVAVCGIPCASRRTEAKSGGFVLFTTLADETGLAECVLFPRDYPRLGAAMRGEIVRAEGRVDETLGALTLVVERVTSVGPAPGGTESAPSRNRVDSPAARAGEAGPPSRYGARA